MDKTYKVAIIGCGGISHMHTRRYLNEPRTNLCAVADVDPERMKAYGEKYGIEKQYTDYIEMLETEEIDIVRTYATGGAGACSEAIYRRPDAQ